MSNNPKEAKVDVNKLNQAQTNNYRRQINPPKNMRTPLFECMSAKPNSNKLRGTEFYSSSKESKSGNNGKKNKD